MSVHSSLLKYVALILILWNEVYAQYQEGYHAKQFSSIVEIANESGILTHPFLLIGHDSTGLIKRANSTNHFKIFASTPASTDLNPGLNIGNKFGAPESNNCYEIRYGSDSSHYWIGSSLATNCLPFAIYNVGAKSRNNPSVSGGVKLCIMVTDDNANGIYDPGERLTLYGDLALPIDSSYAEYGQASTNPFKAAQRYLANMRTGKAGIDYSATTFNTATDGELPHSGSVIRLISQLADSAAPFIYFQDTVFAYRAGRYLFPFSYFSFENPLINLINAPSGMTLSGDTVVWNVTEDHYGQDYSVAIELTNAVGTSLYHFAATCIEPDMDIIQLCNEIKTDSLYSYIMNLQNFGTRFALASNHRIVAEWIKNKFLEIGYSTARIDSFYRTNIEYPYASGTFYDSWGYNVVADLTGSENPDSVYIIGAHWDSYCYNVDPFLWAPGADDNASGVAAVLEIARICKIKGYNPSSTVRFVCFDFEELYHLGSEHYAQNARVANERIQYMLNMDMIGYVNVPITDWKICLQYYYNSAEITDLAVQCSRHYSNLGIRMDTAWIWGSDSWQFYLQNYKTIFLLENSLSPHLHWSTDTLGNYNMNYAKEISKVAFSMLLVNNGTVLDIKTHDKDNKKNLISLHKNYPNPFNPTTTICYELPVNGKVSLKIYNVLGQEVRMLVNGYETAGTKQVVWDGKDSRGQAVSSGVYFYRLVTPGFTKTMKMMMMR